MGQTKAKKPLTVGNRSKAHFLERPLTGRDGIGPIHLNGLAQGQLQVLEQFFPALILPIDANNLFKPTDPPTFI